MVKHVVEALVSPASEDRVNEPRTKKATALNNGAGKDAKTTVDASTANGESTDTVKGEGKREHNAKEQGNGKRKHHPHAKLKQMYKKPVIAAASVTPAPVQIPAPAPVHISVPAAMSAPATDPAPAAARAGSGEPPRPAPKPRPPSQPRPVPLAQEQFRELHGFEKVPIVGDGNCLFRAIAHIVYYDEERHARVRSQIVQHMRYRADTARFPQRDQALGYREHLNDECRKTKVKNLKDANMRPPSTWQEYLDAMERDGTCGGMDELTIAKDVYPETQLLLVHPDDLTTKLEQAHYMGPRLIFEREIEHFNVLERTAAAKAAHRAAVNSARRH